MPRKYVNEKEEKIAVFRKEKMPVYHNRLYEKITDNNKTRLKKSESSNKDLWKRDMRHKFAKTSVGDGLRNLIGRAGGRNINNIKEPIISPRRPRSYTREKLVPNSNDKINFAQENKKPPNRIHSNQNESQKRGESRNGRESQTGRNSRGKEQLLYSSNLLNEGLCSSKRSLSSHHLNQDDYNTAVVRVEDPSSKHKRHRTADIPSSRRSSRLNNNSRRSQSIGNIQIDGIPSGFFNSLSESSSQNSAGRKLAKTAKSGDCRSLNSSSTSIGKGRKHKSITKYKSSKNSKTSRQKQLVSYSPPLYHGKQHQKIAVDVYTDHKTYCDNESLSSGVGSQWGYASPDSQIAPPTPAPRLISQKFERISRLNMAYKGDHEIHDIAEAKHQLHKEKLRSEEILDEKNRLTKELQALRKQYDNIYMKYTSLKVENDKLVMLDLERQNLLLTIDNQKEKLAKLYEIIEKNELADIEKDQKLINLEKEKSKLTQESNTYKLERDHLSKHLIENDQGERQMSEMKKKEHEKDLKIRIMHNELVELKGNIRVLARFKPEKETNQYKFIGTDGVQVKRLDNEYASNKSKPSKIYNFSHVFRPSATQPEVYEEVSPYVTSCIDGYNVCVITYGQTGSGKTYTMKGNQGNPGIIGRAMTQIFNECSQRSVWKYRLYISILQIYNEHMTDLLTDTVNRVHIQDDGNTVFIKGLREFRVKTQEDIVHYIILGRQRRTTTKTVLNFDSSRSHFIVMLRVHGSSSVHDQSTQGILTLCDLAGFERLSNKHPNNNIAMEAKYISKSLTVLARVFEALRRHHRSVPFRESKLTHLLKPSLSGEAKCVLILTLSTLLANIESSTRTLEFGTNAMKTSLGVAKQNVRKQSPDDSAFPSALNALAASTPSENSDNDDK